jgi:hypothetical protein
MKFPLYENEVASIISSFEISPYGRGEKTIVDTRFRNSWQLNPEQFEVVLSSFNTKVNCKRQFSEYNLFVSDSKSGVGSIY